MFVIVADGREKERARASEENEFEEMPLAVRHLTGPSARSTLTFGVADTNLLDRFDQVRHDDGDHLLAERIHASAVLLDLLRDRLDST